MTKLERVKGLNEVRELLYSLYPDAKAITVEVSADKIKVKPNEEYTISAGAELDEEE